MIICYFETLINESSGPKNILMLFWKLRSNTIVDKIILRYVYFFTYAAHVQVLRTPWESSEIAFPVASQLQNNKISSFGAS